MSSSEQTATALRMPSLKRVVRTRFIQQKINLTVALKGSMSFFYMENRKLHAICVILSC